MRTQAKHYKRIKNRISENKVRIWLKDMVEKKGKLYGAHIVLAGHFKHTEKELKELIKENGGKNASSIAKNIDFFLKGDKCSAFVLQKVKEFKIPVITEEELFEHIGVAVNESRITE